MVFVSCNPPTTSHSSSSSSSFTYSSSPFTSSPNTRNSASFSTYPSLHTVVTMKVKPVSNTNYSPVSESGHSYYSSNASYINNTPDTYFTNSNPQTPYDPRYFNSFSPTYFSNETSSTSDNEVFFTNYQPTNSTNSTNSTIVGITNTNANTNNSTIPSPPFINHLRTASLPTNTTFSFKLPSVPNSASSANSTNCFNLYSSNEQFSRISDADNLSGLGNFNCNNNNNTNKNYNNNNYPLAHQLTNLSLDINPPAAVNFAQRPNPLYSENSTSSIITTNSLIPPLTNTSQQLHNTNSLSTMHINNNLTSIQLQQLSETSTSSSFSSDSELITIDLSLLSPNEIILLSKDQNGCRMLQTLLDDDANKNLPLIFNATYKNSSALMLDPFGNYLIQKLMICSTASQISLILIDISGNIGKIATNLHGTRALQKLIGCLTTPNHHDLIAFAISNVIVDLIHDLNGNHVIQKLISHFFGNDLEFLIDLVITHLVEIATHKHGCCVLQKLLNKCSKPQIQKISDEILRNSVYLMKDQFGNYVIQYLISLKIDAINYELLKLVANELTSLSCGKFSSNVVEKCLKLNPKVGSINRCIHPLLASMVNIQTLVSLIKDQYGNYVVQTALEIADYPIKCVMAEMIRPVLNNIKNSNYGKRIHSKVLQILSEMELNNTNYNGNILNTNTALLPGINFSAHN